VAVDPIVEVGLAALLRSSRRRGKFTDWKASGRSGAAIPSPPTALHDEVLRVLGG
jgi:hypothetical protein